MKHLEPLGGMGYPAPFGDSLFWDRPRSPAVAPNPDFTGRTVPVPERATIAMKDGDPAVVTLDATLRADSQSASSVPSMITPQAAQSGAAVLAVLESRRRNVQVVLACTKNMDDASKRQWFRDNPFHVEDIRKEAASIEMRRKGESYIVMPNGMAAWAKDVRTADVVLEHAFPASIEVSALPKDEAEELTDEIINSYIITQLAALVETEEGPVEAVESYIEDLNERLGEDPDRVLQDAIATGDGHAWAAALQAKRPVSDPFEMEDTDDIAGFDRDTTPKQEPISKAWMDTASLFPPAMSSEEAEANRATLDRLTKLCQEDEGAYRAEVGRLKEEAARITAEDKERQKTRAFLEKETKKAERAAERAAEKERVKLEREAARGEKRQARVSKTATKVATMLAGTPAVIRTRDLETGIETVVPIKVKSGQDTIDHFKALETAEVDEGPLNLDDLLNG